MREHGSSVDGDVGAQTRSLTSNATVHGHLHNNPSRGNDT